ncbi:MAG: BACON domain-containing protein [Sodaliphilus sp.]
MKNLMYLAVLMAISAVAVSCNREATYLKSDSQEIKIAKAGGKDSMILHSDGRDFQIIITPEWMNATLVDSVLYVSVDENETNSSRSGNIVLKNGNQKLSLLVTQASTATYMTIKRKSVTIGQNGEADTLAVFTDGSDVHIENVKDIHTEFKNGVLTVTGKGNKGATRKTKAKLVCDDISVDLLVIETGTYCPRCKGNGRVTCYICSGEGITYCPVLPCRECNGSGRIRCPGCNGKGK